jgi:hypothetical protein
VPYLQQKIMNSSEMKARQRANAEKASGPDHLPDENEYNPASDFEAQVPQDCPF